MKRRDLFKAIGAALFGGLISGTPSPKVKEVDVKEFGAVGDGLTNDSEAFWRAVNSGADTVHVGPGTYCLCDTVVTNCTICGHGKPTFITTEGNTMFQSKGLSYGCS